MSRTHPLLCVFLLLSTMPAGLRAQADAAGRRSGRERVDIFGGYSHISNSFLEHDSSSFKQGMNGFDIGVGVRLWRGLGVKADVIGYRGDWVSLPQNATFFFGGVVYSVPIGRETVFAEAMLGTGHLDSNGLGVSFSSTPYLLGGGVDSRVIRHLAIRVEGGILHVNTTSSSDQIHGMPSSYGQLSTGLVARF